MVNDMKLLFENWRRYLDEDDAGQEQVARDLQDPEFYKYRDPSVWISKNPSYSAQPAIDGRDRESAAGGVFDLGRTLKKVFAKNADREFIDSLVTMHYSRLANQLRLLQSWSESKSGRDELSCAAFLPEQPKEEMLSDFAGGECALEVRGYITVLAGSMDDLVTGNRKILRRHSQTSRTRDSGLNKGIGTYAYERKQFLNPNNIISGNLILDKEDYIERAPADRSRGNVTEALVDNWTPVGLYFMRNWGAAGPDCERERDGIVRKIELMKRAGKLPKEFVVKFTKECP